LAEEYEYDKDKALLPGGSALPALQDSKSASTNTTLGPKPSKLPKKNPLSTYHTQQQELSHPIPSSLTAALTTPAITTTPSQFPPKCA